MIEISHCNLVDLQENHRDLLFKWRNQKHIRINMYHDQIISPQAHNLWFDRALASNGIIGKIMVWKDTPLGFVNFTNFDPVNNRCEWGFYIGEPKAPKGAGKIMGILALDYIFHVQHIRKLCAEVLSVNHKSLQYHQRLGFVEEGRLKEHLLRNNGYIDVIVYALFPQKWNETRGQLLKEWRKQL